MNPSHRLTWTLPLVLALALMGLISSVAVAITPATEELSLPCEAAESIEEGAIDTDNDGLTDQEETDGKLSQGQEDATTWDPTEPDNPDTDRDGVCDGDEIHGFKIQTNSTGPDGKPIELTKKTDPNKEDTDGDGFTDGQERNEGTDPQDLDDHPDAPTLTPEPPPESPTPTPTPTPDKPLRFDVRTFSDQTFTAGSPIPDLTLPGATGGDSPLKYEVSDLPPGFTFDPDNRTISGAPTEAGIFPVEYTVTDSDDANPGSDRLIFNMDVKLPPPGNVRVNTDGLIEWDQVPGANSYEAQYRSPNGDWTEAKAEGQLKGKIPSPGAGTGYQVRVRAKHTDTKLHSDWSLPIPWETPAAAPVIPTPEQVSQSPSPTDTDRDGLTDADEIAGWDIKVTFMDGDEVTIRVKSDPAKADTDGDGKNDKAEKQAQTDPGRADTDGDGIPDAEELSPFQFDNRTLNTAVTKADTDSDGLPDRLEKHSLKTDPTHEDSDRDGLTDMEEVAGWEIQIEVNGKRNWVKVYSNPMTKDSDGDGIEDKVEKVGWQIQVNGAEVKVYSNPMTKDSDGDGIEDKVEKEGWQIQVNEIGNWVEVSSNPSSSDTDGDGLKDGEEHQGFTVAIAGKPLLAKTNPSSIDTDGDGKDDNLEIAGWSISVLSDDNGFKTDPSRSDSDGDGLPDFIVSGGTGQDPNPLEPDRGLPGTILGVLGTALVSGQTPYSLLAVLVAGVGGMGWMWRRATRAVTGDAALQELRDQGHELDQLRREYGNLDDRTKSEISRLQENVSSKDREVHQLQADLATYQASARRREEDLNSAGQDLVRAADELGERQWSDLIKALTGVGGQDTAQGDGNRVTASVSRHVNGLKRQVSEQKGRARELVSSLRTQGLDISGIQGAVDRAPATALPSLIDSLEAVVQQHTIESQGKERLLLDIERAEAHCSRDITDSVGRRVPLQFLSRAREMLEQATTQVELNAAVIIGDRIVDDIYRLYLPRATR